jgi:hypothetical protein
MNPFRQHRSADAGSAGPGDAAAPPRTRVVAAILDQKGASASRRRWSSGRLPLGAGPQKLIGSTVVLSLIGMGLMGSSCSSPVFSLPCSPSIPTTPSYYPAPAQRVQSTSINFELDNQYMTALVQSLVQTPNASSGINVTGTSLSEQGTGNNVVNLLTVDFAPWKGNPQAQLGSGWQLDLTITPYLVNNQTVPNPANLMEILGNTGTEGLVLRFGYSALRDATGANVTSVSVCSSASPTPTSSATTTDLTTYTQQTVLAGILSQLGSIAPIIFPTAKVAEIANNLIPRTPFTAVPMGVNGVNVGTDGSLKLGFAFSNLPPCPQGCQPTAPFDPSPYFNPGAEPEENYDWNLDITPGFLLSIFWVNVLGQMKQSFPNETPFVTNVVPSLEYPNPVDPKFVNSPIILTIYAGANGSCGTFNFSDAPTITLKMVTDPNGDSVAQETETKPDPDPGPGQAFKYACWLADQGIFWVFSVFDVGTVISTSVCPGVLGEPIELSTPTGDALYGTGMVTGYGDLVILGRSKMLDGIDGTRITVPPCTPPS